VTDSSRIYLLVAADRPLEAAAVVSQSTVAPDLCVRSPSLQSRATADSALAGHYVPTIVEPLLVGRRDDEDSGDFTLRCADALRALYALDTRCALVVFDVMPGGPEALRLDDASLLRLAERLERSVPSDVL
jgi:hypothetical protein